MHRICVTWQMRRDEETTSNYLRNIYSSSSSSPPASLLAAAAARLRFTRPGRPPPYGDVSAKSMCLTIS